MRHLNLQSFTLGLGTCLLAASIATPSTAQTVQSPLQMNEPARWTQEDITPQQKYSTATKEAIAAQQQSIQNCQLLDPLQRTTCITLARTTYKEEMTLIRSHFAK